MNHLLFKSILIVILSFIYGCGGGSTSEGSTASTITPILSGNGSLIISGTISYQRIQPNNNFIGLNTNNITTEKAKGVVVAAIDSSGSTIASSTTDSSGNYSLTGIPASNLLKIRVYARIIKSSGWDVKVVDNSNSDAQYVLEGSFASTGTTNSTRDLTALSSNTSSAPFAILDSIYQAMQKILTADSNVEFPTLKVNWSTSNITTNSFYTNSAITLQGDQNGDSDEYDHHIIIHEWGHYFEDKFSRADSIGGNHSSGNHLDIRVAFGEGFGNAFSAIVTDDPIYFDSYGSSNGWSMNIETATKNTPGFFSEASIQRVLYDLYDSNNDSGDTLSLGFTPLYNIFVGEQKTTSAFTSIFSFITALKSANSSSSTQIDSIVNNEDISTITDIYGSNRVDSVDIALNSDILPLYNSLDIGNTLNRCTVTTYGVTNKLGNNKYVRFTVASAGSYTITLNQTNGSLAVPDFQLFKVGTKTAILQAENASRTNVSRTTTLATGDYLLNIRDNAARSRSCFDISIN